MEKIKSSDMPDVQVFNYDVFYRATPIFMNDLKIILGNIAYVDAKKFFDCINAHNGIFPAAVLNEFLRNLGSLPYKIVSPLMAAIEDNTKFVKYFEQLAKEEIQQVSK